MQGYPHVQRSNNPSFIGADIYRPKAIFLIPFRGCEGVEFRRLCSLGQGTVRAG